MRPVLYQIIHTLIFLIRMILIKAFLANSVPFCATFFEFCGMLETQLAVGVSARLKSCATSEGVKFFIYIF